MDALLTHDDRVRRKAEKYSQVDDGDEVEVDMVHTTNPRADLSNRYDVSRFRRGLSFGSVVLVTVAMAGRPQL